MQRRIEGALPFELGLAGEQLVELADERLVVPSDNAEQIGDVAADLADHLGAGVAAGGGRSGAR